MRVSQNINVKEGVKYALNYTCIEVNNNSTNSSRNMSWIIPESNMIA